MMKTKPMGFVALVSISIILSITAVVGNLGLLLLSQTKRQLRSREFKNLSQDYQVHPKSLLFNLVLQDLQK
jgi:hypothetical protein